MKSLIVLSSFAVLYQNNDLGVAGARSVIDVPIVKGVHCQSRTLESTLAGNETAAIIADNLLTSTLPFCPDGYFCDLTSKLDDDGANSVLGLCKPCSGSSDHCQFSVETKWLEQAVTQECQEQCGVEKNTCSKSNPCKSGLYCNFENGPDSGFCEGCPLHLYFCEDEGALSPEGISSCQASCGRQCYPTRSLGISGVPFDGLTLDTETSGLSYIEDVNTMFGSPQLKASGPIVDCGLGLEPCEGVDGAVCFIERGKAPFINKTLNCYEGGGVAAVIYNVEASCENIFGSLSGRDAFIPVVTLTHIDGKAILKQANEAPQEKPLLASVVVGGYGVDPEYCLDQCTKEVECPDPDTTCNFDNIEFGDCKAGEHRVVCNDAAGQFGDTEYLPCTNENEFCDMSLGKRGYCTTCPETDAACFFSDLNGQGAKECAAVCMGNHQQELESAPCKFCPKGSFDIGDIGDGFLSTKTEMEEVDVPCEFCATSSASTCSSIDRWDMAHPERTIRMFGGGVECWAVAEFYRSLNIDAGSTACQSARFYNYICGCSDSIGYAGANTEMKQMLLVWVPRVGAILSMLGSILMIIGVLRDPHRKKRVIGELIIFLCVFDIIGSLGYAFTSFPTPLEDYLYGAAGNQASCTAQGFIIQMGTVALYANVSIAFYYLLIIQYSWREHTIRKSWVYRMLFLAPVIIGCLVAFTGLPFYDNAVLWCNNSRNYWSEIPVIIGIAVATIIMVNLCWFVYKSERASKRFRRHNDEERNSLSKAFFMQALVYLGSFYLTWPAYLALQLMIARGYAFSYYGFYLYAGTALTLQGFWNFAFHTGLHTQPIGKKINEVWSSVKSVGSRSFYSRRSSNISAKSSDISAIVDAQASTGPLSSNVSCM